MIVSGSGFIPLRTRDGSVRAWAVVDEADYVELNAVPWCLVGTNSRGYRRQGYASTRRPGERRVAMHRLLLGLDHGDPRQGDHINGDTLNNRRGNLRIVSATTNGQNRGSDKGSTSQYRGVSWAKSRGQWVASCRLDGRLHHLGYFTDEVEAAEAAAAFRRQHMPFSVEGR